MFKQKVSIVSMSGSNNMNSEGRADALKAIKDKEEMPLLFIREKDNEFDSNAVMVYTTVEGKTAGNKLGYVAASEKYIKENYLSAKEVAERMDSLGMHMCLTSLDLENYEEVYGGNIYLFTANLKDEEETGEVDETVNLEFSISGSVTLYPQKQRLVTDFNEGTMFEGIKVKKEDMLIGYYLDEPIGTVLKGDESNVLEYMGSNNIMAAYIEDVERGIFRCVAEELLTDEGKAEVNLNENIARITSLSIMKEEEVEKRIELMKEYNIADNVIAMVLDSYFKYPEKVKENLIIPKTFFNDEEGLVNQAISSIMIGDHLRFEGPKGTGKNTMTETLAYILNRPLYEFPINSGLSNQAIFGSETFEANDKGEQVLVFKKSAIIEAFEVGGIIVLDEFNTGLPDMLTSLNGLMDFRERAYVDRLGVIHGHDNFVAIATENIGYAGTFDTHAGTSDRLAPVVFPNPSIGKLLKAKYPEAKRRDIEICERLYVGMENSVEVGDLDEKSISIRGFESAIKQVVLLGVPLKEALTQNIAYKTTVIEDRESILSTIDMLFA